MAKACGYCVYMDLNVMKDGKYQCERDKVFRFATSSDAQSCYKYCERFRRDMDRAEEAIKNSKRYQEANKSYEAVGCYITTVVVNILGESDTIELLMTLRKFRKEVLQVDPKYRDILFKYDALGPVLARAIVASKDRVSLAMDIYNIYLKGCKRYIEKGEYDKAVELYKELTNSLIERFIGMKAVGSKVYESYDQQSGGHGAIKLTQM